MSKKSKKSKIRILVAKKAYRRIKVLAEQAEVFETGGIIAGSGSVKRKSMVITHASDGGPKTHCSPSFFSRDTEYCQTLLDKWVSESSGDVDYLGEWHKHFEDTPTPSSKDIETLSRIAKDRKYHVAKSLLLIIGNSNDVSTLRIYIVERNGKYHLMNWELGDS